MQGRLIYEDQGARISIMARASAHGPDTLQQTVRDQLAKIYLQTGGGPYISERTRHGRNGWHGLLIARSIIENKEGPGTLGPF
jgi:hypothetical protein